MRQHPPALTVYKELSAMLFIDNKYTRWYYSIIANAQSRTFPLDVYTEKHHIIPRSLGGNNSKSNLVVLTAKEHFLCHLLLPKMLTGQSSHKMIYALYCITHVRNKGQTVRHIPNSRLFNKIKEDWQSSIKGRVAHNKGKPMSADQKEKLRQANLGKTYIRSEEYLQKQSVAQQGKSKGKGRVSNRKGITISEEQKEKIRNTLLRRYRG